MFLTIEHIDQMQSTTRSLSYDSCPGSCYIYFFNLRDLRKLKTFKRSLNESFLTKLQNPYPCSSSLEIIELKCETYEYTWEISAKNLFEFKSS